MKFVLPCAFLLLAACSNKPAAVRSGPPEDWFQIQLGANDKQPTDHSGSLVTAGVVTGVESWRFHAEDSVDPAAARWTTKTRYALQLIPADWYVAALHIRPKDIPPDEKKTIPVGVFAGFRDAAEVTLRTPRGEAKFSPAVIRYGAPASLMDGGVLVDRVPAARKLSANDGREDDYPAIAALADGTNWVAWVSYKDEREQLVLARADGSERQVIAEGEFFRPSLAAGVDGRFYLAVSVHEADTWKIAVARYDGRWSKLEDVTGGGPDLFPRMAVAPSGKVWLTWQGYRGDRSRILARSGDGRVWDPETAVSENSRNAWEPSIAADKDGNVHVAWDAYDDGVYNVYYRKLGSAQQRVQSSERFQAHAAVACGPDGTVWLAWDEAGANWGKDTGFVLRNNTGTRLYENRRVRLIDMGRQKEAQLPAGHFEQPQLAVRADGSVYLLVRRRYEKLHAVFSQSLQRNRMQQYSMMDYAVVLPGSDHPVTLGWSLGRNDLRAGIAATGNGFAVTWAGDGRLWAKPYPFIKNNVFSAHATIPGRMQPRMEPITASQTKVARVHPEEDTQIATMAAYRIPAGGKQLRILRGDMHRHTDVSFDGDLDGSVWDAYRYFIDAAGFEYSALTDHNAGEDINYFWWLSQKACDLYHYPGRFTPLYAYERSLRYPNGHRNLIWSKRGVKSLPRSKEEEAGTEGAAKLYEHLRRTGGLAMSHTSGTLMGTDWRDNDPELEPIAEIYQGDRMSYETDGAPRAPKSSDKLTQPGGYQPEGYLWKAWAKGLKLGVQASSDHASTHISYAVILAEDSSREKILEAIRARHSYAATDNIVLDVRSGDHIQGDIFESAEAPLLSIHVEGTAPVASLTIVKNNQYVHQSRPGGRSVNLTWKDSNPSRGESYYYVRVVQADGQVAWSSPIWITTPGR